MERVGRDYIQYGKPWQAWVELERGGMAGIREALYCLEAIAWD